MGRRKWRIVGVILLVVLCLRMLRGRMPLTVVKNNLLGDIDRSSHNQLIEPLRDVAGYKWSEIPAEYKFDCIRIPRFSQHLANNVLIIFLGKSEVDAWINIAKERRWNWKVIEDYRNVTVRDIMPDNTVFPIIYTLSYVYGFRYMKEFQNLHTGLVMSIRMSFKVTGNKITQLISMREAFQQFGCRLEDISIMPPTFYITEREDCLSFFKYAKKGLRWVLKPSIGYGGSGITLHDDLEEIKKLFGQCQGRPDNVEEDCVIQQYIPNLLLLNGFKFDIRAVVLIASTTPFLMFFHEGFLRVSTELFSEDSTDRRVHFTNTHVQQEVANASINDHLWSFDRFQKYIEEFHPQRKDFVERELVPFIKNVGRLILRAGQGIYRRIPGTFQLLGLDFLVTADFKVQFIEANNHPYWPIEYPDIEPTVHSMLEDMFDLLLRLNHNPDSVVHMKNGDTYKSWQLISSEIEERCNVAQLFNPCKINFQTDV